ncbi:MAG: hypothetical protein AABY49_01535 [Planctomycetota bacterium]
MSIYDTRFPPTCPYRMVRSGEKARRAGPAKLRVARPDESVSQPDNHSGGDGDKS